MSQRVCVVGDGPAGSAAAIAAMKTGAEVTIFGTGSRLRHGTLERIDAQARFALETLELLGPVTKHAVPCTGVVSRWATDTFVERSSMVEVGGSGWIVDRSRFDPFLLSIAIARGARLVRHRARSIEFCSGTITVRSDFGVEYADDVLTATGRGTNSLGVSPSVVREEHLALSIVLPAGVICELGHQLLIDNDEWGWWSALSDGETTNVTYYTDPALLPSGPHRVRQGWDRACGFRPGWLPPVASALVPRARSSRVSTPALPIEPRVQLVGDAALSVDPLSGHGLALAFETAVRCTAPGYAEWLEATSRDHAQQGLLTHGKVLRPARTGADTGPPS
jgi:2-polyprenyl-6-methoxyphenol hydroxylase-like FAD-dependent oxidoreductase